ncbi:carbohydrate kinase family protein [Profundibacterium mesophilum]|uniref:Fructokinase n=1 Tax=Profundibacterium mesophilum KAUST100406-0324 TaxID=1037889 RepID=A0A921TBD1_9RHOB|nr:carbohydrate kinase [Profundibacterium mesophilum]KAF0675375.1 Fructokinase [Profundibacterium mesophilum KAUST100406-0324]
MILCCGEALIDMLPRSIGQEQVFAPHAGGAVFNTAIALGRLDVATALFSGLSRDMFGEMLVEALGASQVDASLAARSDLPTTLAFVTLVDGQARYAFYDENTAGRMLSQADLPDPGERCEALFFGGISLAVEPCAAAYEALAARESDKRVIMLDPNIRPDFIKDEAAYRARIDRMIARADIVKLSDDDLRWLMGDGSIPELASGILERGPALVCITEGAEGASAYHAGGTLRVPARPVEVVDTVGAGDTFNAGILAALSRGGALGKSALRALGEDQVRAALQLGVQAAAVTVSRAGANPPRAGEL